MKKIIILTGCLLIYSSTLYGKKIEQTICFSQTSCVKFPIAELGNNVQLCGGKCQGRSIIQMNKKGWKVVQIISGLSNSFGILLEKK